MDPEVGFIRGGSAAFWTSGVAIQPAQRLRKIEYIPRTYPQVAVYEGNPFIWGTWGMFLGSVGIYLEVRKAARRI